MDASILANTHTHIRLSVLFRCYFVSWVMMDGLKDAFDSSSFCGTKSATVWDLLRLWILANVNNQTAWLHACLFSLNDHRAATVTFCNARMFLHSNIPKKKNKIKNKAVVTFYYFQLLSRRHLQLIFFSFKRGEEVVPPPSAPRGVLTRHVSLTQHNPRV